MEMEGCVSIGFLAIAAVGSIYLALTETPEEKKRYQEQRKKWEEREAEAKERKSWYQQV